MVVSYYGSQYDGYLGIARIVSILSWKFRTDNLNLRALYVTPLCRKADHRGKGLVLPFLNIIQQNDCNSLSFPGNRDKHPSAMTSV